RHLNEPALAPLEEAPGLPDRIDHVGHLERLREEVLMDELVMTREKYAEVRMGVVPADDVQIGMKPVAPAADLLPRVVGVGEAGLRVLIMLGLERLGHQHEGRA